MTTKTDRLANALGAMGCSHPRSHAVLMLEVWHELEEDDLTIAHEQRAEVRVVHPITGAEKGKKLARFDLIPPKPLWRVAEMYGAGAFKYEDRNWERGNDWSLSFAALMRHAWAFWNGEDDDPETELPHLAAVVFHALALMQYGETHPNLDDRPR